MKPPAGLRFALLPFSLLYGAGASLRARLYRKGMLGQARLPQIVVSVGNLTVGGTGKTPMVLWLAERLLAEGKRVAILARGYGGTQNRNAGSAKQSDEVRLLLDRTRSQVPIGVGADRRREARRMEKEGVEWFVLDDGFQHLQLARDVDIVLVDATDPFGGGILPAGGGREPRSALARADILVITRSTNSSGLETLLRRYSQAPIFRAETKLESIQPLHGPSATPPDLPGELKFFGFCGIGNPEAFWSDLEKWGFHLAGRRAFRDHHEYTAKDLLVIQQSARAAGADALVCTEKDRYNLPEQTQFGFPAYFCRISMRLDDPEGLWRAIVRAIERLRRAGAA